MMFNLKTGDIIKTQNPNYPEEEGEYGYVIKEDETYFHVYWFDDRETYKYLKKYEKHTFIKVSE